MRTATLLEDEQVLGDMKALLSLACFVATLLALGSSSGSSLVTPEDSARYARLLHEARQGGLDSPKLDNLLEEAVKIYAQDGDLWWRLGQQRLAAKRYDDGIFAYNKALEFGAFGNKFRAAALYDLACAYALKGQKDKAYDLLNKSMAAGWRDLDHLRTDADLNSLHSDKRWEELAATKDVSKMTRDQGWRYDLWLMHREVSRIHYNPYTKHTKGEQDAWVRKLHNQIPKMKDNEIAAAFMKYMTRVGDGHTSIRPGDHGRYQSVPIQVFWFEEGVFVTAADPKFPELVGAQILEVGGKTIEQLAPALNEVTPQDNPQGLKSLSGRFFTLPVLLNALGLIPDEKSAAYKVKTAAGEVRTVTLEANSAGPTDTWLNARDSKTPPLYLKSRDKAYWFEHLPALKAVYLQYNAVRNEPAETTEVFMKRVHDFIDANDVERLIVDVRWNGGGNSFLNRPIVNGIIGCEKINKRDKLFVITGRNTFSAAQNFTTDLDRALDPIFVGEPTGSAPNFVGETVRFNLPYSKMTGSISDLYWQRSWPMDHRMWIAPDLPAHPSWEAFRANRDPAMEAIEAYLKGGS